MGYYGDRVIVETMLGAYYERTKHNVYKLISLYIDEDAIDKIVNKRAVSCRLSSSRESLIIGLDEAQQRKYRKAVAYIEEASIPKARDARAMELARLAMPQVGEAYDNMPERYIKKGDLSAIMDEYMRAFGWPDVNTCMYAEVSLHSKTSPAFVAIQMEYNRIRELPVDHPYVKTVLNGEFFPLSQKQMRSMDTLIDWEIGDPEPKEKAQAFIEKAFKTFDKKYTGGMNPIALRHLFASVEAGTWLTLNSAQSAQKAHLDMPRSLLYYSLCYLKDSAYALNYCDCSHEAEFKKEELVFLAQLALSSKTKMSDVISYYLLAKRMATQADKMASVISKSQSLAAKLDGVTEALRQAKEELQKQHKRAASKAGEHAEQKRKLQQKYEKELNELRAQNKKLKAQVQITTAQLKNLQETTTVSTYSEEEMDAMRELLYSRAQENEDVTAESLDAEMAGEHVRDTDARILVIGGHKRWKSNMQSLFPTLRFIDAEEMAFDTDVITKADAIWIQAWHISHPLFWKACRAAKAKLVPVRYFTTNGVSRSAQELDAYISEK